MNKYMNEKAIMNEIKEQWCETCHRKADTVLTPGSIRNYTDVNFHHDPIFVCDSCIDELFINRPRKIVEAVYDGPPIDESVNPFDEYK